MPLPARSGGTRRCVARLHRSTRSPKSSTAFDRGCTRILYCVQVPFFELRLRRGPFRERPVRLEDDRASPVRHLPLSRRRDHPGGGGDKAPTRLGLPGRYRDLPTPHGTREFAMKEASSGRTSAANEAANFALSKSRKPSAALARRRVMDWRSDSRPTCQHRAQRPRYTQPLPPWDRCGLRTPRRQSRVSGQYFLRQRANPRARQLVHPPAAQRGGTHDASPVPPTGYADGGAPHEPFEVLHNGRRILVIVR